ncbi:type II toxin-antitoxin system RelE/ParE family toxin [bacterium]|nr:type II toxin-antitoxin system RelE/ParE family toxin [bacterium]MBU2416333.1 type II toxin-antitoxin system RelE/ParE family toxin [Patescibacteria group bacterium]
MKFTYDFVEINGKVPMIEFLDGLSLKECAKIFAYIDKLVELKNSKIQPKENLSKYLDDGIFELRVNFKNRISRSFYFYESEKQIIFTHGIIKKSQRVPKTEIERAKTIRKTLIRGER